MLTASRRSWMLAYALFLTSLGLAYVALQPPFEGFDEFAHYSSLRQVAHTGSIPTEGASYLDTETTEYQGPMPYGSGTPPFHAQLGAKSYAEFFGDPVNPDRFVNQYGAAGRRSRFQASRVANWQAQHPPLYYLLMTPVVWATDHLPFVSQIFFLRLVSYLMAIGGVLFGLAAVRRGRLQPAHDRPPEGGRYTEHDRPPEGGHYRDYTVAAGAGFLFYPLLLPQFFPEFARIGNDALCLLLLGWLLYLIVNENPTQRIRRPWLIGLVLGAGLLTKAFFLPVTAAVVVWLVFCRIWTARGTVSTRVLKMPDVAAIVVSASVVGGWWYVHQFLVFGAFTGGDEAIQLAQGGGLLKGLQQHFSSAELVRGLATVPVTWVWAGTWSLARLPTSMQVPLVLLALWVTVEFLRLVPLDRPQDPNWLTILMVAGICFGLANRALQGIALGGSGHSGGWYLHILMPWIALAMGRGILVILQRPVARYLFFSATIFALAFHLIAIWSLAALFSGCAVKGDDKFFHFSTGAYCLDQAPLMFARLGVVAWPGMALCALAAAAASGFYVYHSARES